MGISKTDLFTAKQNEIADIARAMGHPARIAILQHLIKANACINNDLVNELGLAQATISQHLKALKEIGLIQGNISGSSMNYCINADKWRVIKEEFNKFFDAHPCCSEGQC